LTKAREKTKCKKKKVKERKMKLNSVVGGLAKKENPKIEAGINHSGAHHYETESPIPS
jgi:hypothetical protein